MEHWHPASREVVRMETRAQHEWTSLPSLQGILWSKSRKHNSISVNARVEVPPLDHSFGAHREGYPKPSPIFGLYWVTLSRISLIAPPLSRFISSTLARDLPLMITLTTHGTVHSQPFLSEAEVSPLLFVVYYK